MKMKESLCDLHIHTTYSDGSAPVERVLDYAIRQNMQYMAITDHDTMDGSKYAERLINTNNLPVCLIPAVEITTRDEETNRPVHILCYGAKDTIRLKELLDLTLKSRENQKMQMLKKIHQQYNEYKIEDALEYAKHSCSIYECHIMQVFCDMGYTNVAIGELMTSLISSKGSCYVPSHYMGTMEILKKLKEIGGIVSIAHPGQFDSVGLIERAIDQELIQAVECFHPRNSSEITEELYYLTEKYHLLRTGGSDFHGQYAKQPHSLGSYGCSKEDTIALLEAIEQL